MCVFYIRVCVYVCVYVCVWRGGYVCLLFSEASGPLSALLLPYFVCSPLWNSPFSADPVLLLLYFVCSPL